MVARLITSSTTGEQEVFLLSKETTTIGRKPNNDIYIDNLSVSGKHAQLITVRGDSFLEDLGSTNGTYVNGKLIKKHILIHGDNITLGKYQITYQSDSSSDEQDSQQTMAIEPSEASLSQAPVVRALDKSVQENLTANPAPSSINDKEACLQLLSGANAGKELILKKALTTIGQPGVQVAAITRRPQGYFLIHVDGGPNNAVPKVADIPIGSSAYELKSHDIIELAGVKMEFYLK
ncbi:MAG: pSer/pThr/pTyr-binding forkhead associated (FHA) protein [Gammaproteobacteria bacterium]|jgi:pSer/pThr/pTyr-binding forkhead associated (FHA) protein